MAAAGRPAWIAPFALCCGLLILLLIASTIVLALIPLYLSRRTYDFESETSDSFVDAAFASNFGGGRAFTLANTNDVSDQVVAQSGFAGDALSIETGNFVPNTAVARRKRQTTSSSAITCERPTGLLGDIFVTRFRVKYPSNCFIASCRERFLNRALTAIRLGNRNITVRMNFTTTESRNVDVQFCSFLNLSTTACVNETRNYVFFIGSNNGVYLFNPNTLNASLLAVANCSGNSTLYSFAVQRNGILWLLYQNGRLHLYSIASRQCLSVNYQFNQSSFDFFKMAFWKNVSDLNERLLISKQGIIPNTLGEINLSNLAITNINNFVGLSASSVDLASTNDGRLFGLFRTSPYSVAQINVNNAALISRSALNVTASPTFPSSGLAWFNNQLYLFEANGISTNIHRINLTANTTSRITNIPQVVIGAASSTCLGT